MNEADSKMNPEPQREEALFQAAAQLAGSARAAFLDSACPGDSVLRQRLEALLAAHEQAEGVLAEPAPAAKATMKIELAEVPDETVGQKIGRYKILEKVGEGGCGVVYVAEQTEPVRRRVALKVIKLGMDTKQVVARFEAERQALAMMDHPNIAKVLDAGATETGRPYFIMELVRGIRVTDYCDQNNLPTNERLELFIKICQAIQHAHQKGIIHRDIKPSNILVTLHDGVPVPKVIDFGIAKATTDQRLTDKTIYTQLQQFVGTPAYMSPEQAEMSGLDIDTRSDIYSLGVLLYELLTGKTPFDANELMSQGIDAMRKTIREQDPLRPSTKLATLKGEEFTTTAKRRSVDRSKLVHQLQGDLDWIVMKSLEKDRTRRYETANGLAMDLKRHLNNETVVARPPSKLYEFQRTVRRHKVGFAATAAIIIILAIGVIMTTWQSVLATRAKKQAVVNEQKAVAAQASETKLREQAQAQELAARQRAYASDMNVAAEALAGNNLGRTLDLLNRQRLQPGQKDLRGWEWRYLWGQTRSDASFTLCKESSEIVSLAVSPDGNLLAIGTRHKGGLSVWDLQSRQELFRLAPDERDARAAFSPTEPLLACASLAVSSSGQRRATLRLCKIATHQILAEFPLDTECVGLAFSKDGQTLVTCTLDDLGGHITLWRMPDGLKLASYPINPLEGPPIGSQFATTPDLKLAAYVYGSSPQRVGVMDLRTGRELWNASPSKEYITALKFSSDGKILASGNGFSDTKIRLWDVATGREIRQLEGHDSWISSLVFLPDGKLASASADQTLRVWDISSGKCLEVLRGNRQEVWKLALLPDTKTLVSGSKDGTVSFWDTSVAHSHQPCVALDANLISWGFDDDGRSVLTLNQQGRLTRWSGPDFQRENTVLEVLTNVDGSLFSTDGRLLAVTATNGILQVWDVSAGVLVRQFTNAPGYVYPWKFLADGTRLWTYSQSDNVNHEWNLATGLEVESWSGPLLEHSLAMDISPDERFCLSLGYEGDAQLRNLADESHTNLNLNFLEGECASYSPDGKLIAAASDLGIARVWETATWKPAATLGGFLNGVHGVSFSPNIRRLALASNGKEAVRIYDTESWQNVFNLEAAGTGFNGVGFSPDGNDIAWGNQSGVLYLWHAPSWAEIHAAEAKDKMEAQQP